MSQETHDPFADFLENLGVNYQEYRPLNDFVKIGGILKEYFTEPESVHTERRIRAALSGDKRILWESPRKPYFGTAPRERMITLEPDGDTINFKLSSRGKDIVFGEDGKVEWNRYFEPEFDSPKKHEIWLKHMRDRLHFDYSKELYDSKLKEIAKNPELAEMAEEIKINLQVIEKAIDDRPNLFEKLIFSFMRLYYKLKNSS